MTHFVCPLHIPAGSKGIVWDSFRLYSQNTRSHMSLHPLINDILINDICVHTYRPLSTHSLPSFKLLVNSKRDLCICVSILGYDSWGTLYEKLKRSIDLTKPLVGMLIKRDEAEEAVRRAIGIAAEYEVPSEGLLLIMDFVKKISSLTRIGPALTDEEEEFRPPEFS